MTIIEEVVSALLLSSPDDLRVIRQYIRWMRVRRGVYDRFYFKAHWIRHSRRYHWL